MTPYLTQIQVFNQLMACFGSVDAIRKGNVLDATKASYRSKLFDTRGKQVDKATGQEVRDQFKAIALDMNGNGFAEMLGDHKLVNLVCI
jgi:hypothetical protein